MLVDLIKIMDRGYDLKEPQQWPIYGTDEALDRTKYVTASEVSRCAREVKFNKLAMIEAGYDPELGTKQTSEVDWGFFERGHTIEDWAVGLIEAGMPVGAGVTLKHTRKKQRSFVGNMRSGTPDGVFYTDTGETYILEVKSIDPRTNFNRLPMTAHVNQVIQNATLVAKMTDTAPTGGVIIYIDASNFKKRRVFHVTYTAEADKVLAERSAWIMAADSPAELPPEGMFNAGCQHCLHTAKCSKLVTQARNEKGENNDHRNASKSFFG